MLEAFISAAEAAGTVVKRFSVPDEGFLYLRGAIEGKTVAASGITDEMSTWLAGIATPEASDKADIGISFAQAGVARTGSLLLELTDPVARSATALPPIHYVVLKASTVVADLHALHDVLAALLAAGRGVYLSLITGPSRTADIERVLTIGVHGPCELHLLILEGV